MLEARSCSTATDAHVYGWGSITSGVHVAVAVNVNDDVNDNVNVNVGDLNAVTVDRRP